MDADPAGNSILFDLLLLLFFTLMNAFFAGAEMAVVSVNKNRIRSLAQEGNKKAKVIEKLFDDSTKFLSTIQIAITFAGFYSSASAAAGISPVLAEWMSCLLYTSYTDASYQAYRDALKAAEAVLSDPDATQEEVSRVYSDLQDAVRGLTTGNIPQTDLSGADGQDKDTGEQEAVQTGDATPITAAAAAMLTALAAVWVIYRKRRNL